jgi:hypothetical protein
MCHGSNSLWAADEVDERLVEKPVAPGGATGGVEFEAMNYVVSLSLHPPYIPQEESMYHWEEGG